MCGGGDDGIWRASLRAGQLRGAGQPRRQLDGIRNVGATADHDNAATSWANLGSAGRSCNATFNYEKSGATASGWADDGYNFTDGGKFALIGGSPNLGNRVTIQVVCEDPDGTGKWPHLFGSTNDFCNIYYHNSNRTLTFKIFNERGESESVKAGKRVTLQADAWERKYATAMWHAGKAALFQSVAPGASIWAGKWNYNWDNLTGQPFYIGGVYFPGNTGDTDNRRLADKIQAIRVYKRALTDAELEHNRLVDEARFKGNPPESNVTIAAGDFDQRRDRREGAPYVEVGQRRHGHPHTLRRRTEDERQRTEDVGQRTAGQSSVLSPLSSVLRASGPGVIANTRRESFGIIRVMKTKAIRPGGL